MKSEGLRTRFLCMAAMLPVVVPTAHAHTVYWTDVGTGKIQRANLDGSSVEDLLTIGVVFAPVEIALDTAGNKMYWTESTLADFMIQRADLDGSNVEPLVKGLVSPSGIALALQPAAIPTVSEWGFLAMTLTLLTGGTILLNRRHNTR